MTFSLPDKYLVIVDIETTDPDECEFPDTPSIIDIAAVTVDRQLNVLHQWTSLVRPGGMHLVTEFTTSLTGIDKPMLADESTWPGVWKDFAAVTNFNRYKMLSWGGLFDSRVLSEEYKRWSIGYPHAWPYLDALSMVYWLAGDYGLHLKTWSLKSACKRFGIEPEKEHRALSGALKCAEVLKEAAAITE